jgi:hypothetical protein
LLGFFLKATIALTMSYVFLSFQVSGKYIFDHLNDFTGPLGENIQQSLGVALDNTWEKSKEVGSKLFTNSKPKIRSFVQKSTDNLKESIKPIVKKETQKVEKEFLEDLKKEEMSHLDKIIDNE